MRDPVARPGIGNGQNATPGALRSPAPTAYPLVCPLSRQVLHEQSIEDAERAIAGGANLVGRHGNGPAPVGRTPTVLVRDDGGCAYPVVGGFPVLLAPERLVPPQVGPFSVDVRAPQYAEAYEEMDFYNAQGERAEAELDVDPGLRGLLRLSRIGPGPRARFPEPADLWLDATYEAPAQWEAFRHLAPLADKRVAQLGGDGSHAVKLLLAGAAEAWVVSPMIGELAHATALARRVGVEDRLRCVAGLAEELPIAVDYLDGIYTISLHHTVTERALPECARVLRAGGVLAAVEPWRAPLYALGTRILGKRQPEVHCRPLTHERVRALPDAFDGAEVRSHGSLLRYPMLALLKLGLEATVRTGWRVGRLDDALASAVPGLRRIGSCAALLGTAPSSGADQAPAKTGWN